MAAGYLGIEAKMDSSATQVISFFTAFRLSDLWYLAQAASNTLKDGGTAKFAQPNLPSQKCKAAVTVHTN